MSVVLTSPAFGYTADDLAKLRLSARKNAEERRLPYTYTTLRKVAAEGADPALSGRAKTFLSVYDRLKKHAAYTDAAELIEEYLNLTKLREYCAAMPGGETAVRNLTQLLSRARAYQASATGNLRAFLDYVENIKKWEIPVNDVSGDAGTNSVRLMTIHASKGMEFPIVILADTSHSFNTMDLQSTMVLHEELGFGPTLFFPKDHLKYGTLAGDAIRNRLQRDLYGEELRLLYVAMTRAEDKLIVTGRLGKKEKLSSQFSVGFHIDRDADRLPYAFVMRDPQSFLRLMLNAVLADVPEAVVARLCESAKNADEDTADTADWHFAIVNPADPLLQTAKVTEQAEDSDWDARKQELTEYREFAYAARRADMPVKISVSYLKKLAYLEKEESGRMPRLCIPRTSRAHSGCSLRNRRFRRRPLPRKPKSPPREAAPISVPCAIGCCSSMITCFRIPRKHASRSGRRWHGSGRFLSPICHSLHRSGLLHFTRVTSESA